MKRSLIAVLIIGLLFFAACGGSSTAPEEPVTQPATGSLKIKAWTRAPGDICYVQISAEQEEWGEDWLGEQEKIAAGASRPST